LIFSGTFQTTNTNNFAAGTVFDGILFDNAAGAFTLGGNSIGLGGDIINDSPNAQTINLPLVLQKSVNLSAVSQNIQIAGAISGAFGITTAGADTVTLTGSNSFSGQINANAGTLVFGAPHALPSGSTISIGAGGAGALASGIGATTIGSLSIAAGGVMDITNNHVLINYGSSDPMGTIYSYVKSGYNGGNWNGPGIISSTAQTATNGFRYGVGWADGKDKVVAGISSGQIELKYTLLGDANLDGTVNGSDFSILAANFGLGVTNWDQGNFLYGSSVNGSDFSALAANFGQGDSGADAAISQSDIAALDAFAPANGLPMPTIDAVPEPASVGLIMIGSIGLLSRRRRRGP
jgi:autotransporter-associated beta strand protein